ncbi:hypothetical protein IFM61606_03836 [Aspergillus udagawae]|uniref:Uncharacterized protein n=1 Tax=Aspergillus udagawae TaxID=91492 RepID=A0ABQ1B5H4_9EURO|nr:hypothetical protein IFM51744_05498 [Aspergillus udagawae]GFF94119.1 hypothetical protein IFM53868_07429 [Aspergillus udagawae]GFG09721.1 hypothetical protein IFM5058_04565 [Aspergillus udagawae]GFG23941.1 hypothetical protein IFM61606_03836 [Aspergillus udagawae]
MERNTYPGFTDCRGFACVGVLTVVNGGEGHALSFDLGDNCCYQCPYALRASPQGSNQVSCAGDFAIWMSDKILRAMDMGCRRHKQAGAWSRSQKFPVN